MQPHCGAPHTSKQAYLNTFAHHIAHRQTFASYITAITAPVPILNRCRPIHTKQSLSLGLCAPTDVKTIFDHIVKGFITCVLRIGVRALRTVHCVCDPCAALCVLSTTLANAGSAAMLLQHDVGIPGSGHDWHLCPGEALTALDVGSLVQTFENSTKTLLSNTACVQQPTVRLRVL